MILLARLWVISVLQGSGFQNVERHETLTLQIIECRNADVTGSRATRPLDGRLLSFPAHNMGAIQEISLTLGSMGDRVIPVIL
jgi:hypothetical protein